MLSVADTLLFPGFFSTSFLLLSLYVRTYVYCTFGTMYTKKNLLLFFANKTEVIFM